MNNNSHDSNGLPKWVVRAFCALLLLGVILGPLAKRHFTKSVAVQKSEPVVEETAPASEEPALTGFQPTVVIPVPLVETADTSVIVGGHKGSFAFESTSSSNQAPTVIPEAQIRELIQAQQQLAAAQK